MKSLILGLLYVISFSAFAHKHGSPGGGAHLTFDGGEYHAHVSWVDGPFVNKESVMKIEWKDGAKHAPIPAPAPFIVEPWMKMNGHEHGTSENKIVQGPTADSYLVKEIFFNMACTWEIRIHLQYPGRQPETQSFLQNVEPDKCHAGHKH